MLTIKKHFANAPLVWAVVSLLIFCGCTPPGPRALLKGERLIRDDKWEPAIERLQEATQLLPKNAQAWNHLGLAYHGNKQVEQALRAYRQALALDHNLAAARFNLGCLYLEQNDAVSAVEQLTSFTLLQPSVLNGWLKLGTAQWRARRFDLAEKNFRTALEMHRNHPEALNGLGLIQFQRKRVQDALSYFNAALAQNPKYNPALLNMAVIYHQSANGRPLALQTYRKYLVQQPRSPEWEKVSATASQLEMELNPPPLALVQANPPAHIAPKTNAVPAVTNFAVRPASNPPTPPVVVATARTNAAPSNPPRVFVQTNSGPTNPFLITNKAPVVEVVRTPTNVVSKPPDIEVTQLTDELIIKPPQEISPVPRINPTKTVAPEKKPAIAIAPPVTPVKSVADTTKPAKRTILSRLNPFGGKSKPATNNVKSTANAAPVTGGKIVLVANASNATPVVMPAPLSLPRYTYLSPAKPASGNHLEAERYFAEGVKAQKSSGATRALAEFQKAAELDPAYFEAHYSEGMAAYELGSWKQSLAAYEFALALKPDSANTRYNFALALKQASYAQDAADELLKIVRDNPSEVRAHLSLGNLYAQQLGQPQAAREHYLKVLAAEPHHPRAAEIRYWLAANP